MACRQRRSHCHCYVAVERKKKNWGGNNELRIPIYIYLYDMPLCEYVTSIGSIECNMHATQSNINSQNLKLKVVGRCESGLRRPNSIRIENNRFGYHLHIAVIYRNNSLLNVALRVGTVTKLPISNHNNEQYLPAPQYRLNCIYKFWEKQHVRAW